MYTKTTKIAGILFLAAALIYGCRKDPSNIGSSPFNGPPTPKSLSSFTSYTKALDSAVVYEGDSEAQRVNHALLQATYAFAEILDSSSWASDLQNDLSASETRYMWASTYINNDAEIKDRYIDFISDSIVITDYAYTSLANFGDSLEYDSTDYNIAIGCLKDGTTGGDFIIVSGIELEDLTSDDDNLFGLYYEENNDEYHPIYINDIQADDSEIPIYSVAPHPVGESFIKHDMKVYSPSRLISSTSSTYNTESSWELTEVKIIENRHEGLGKAEIAIVGWYSDDSGITEAEPVFYVNLTHGSINADQWKGGWEKMIKIGKNDVGSWESIGYSSTFRNERKPNHVLVSAYNPVNYLTLGQNALRYYSVYEWDWGQSQLPFGDHVDSYTNETLELFFQSKFDSHWFIHSDFANTWVWDNGSVVDAVDLYDNGIDIVEADRIELKWENY